MNTAEGLSGSTSTSMSGFRCWTSRDVRDTVYSDIGMLPAEDDTLFLAAHSPVRLRHTLGVQPPGDPASGEAAVMASLLAEVGDENRNTLIALTGDSGSGKSHIVRWVHAHLSYDETFHVLYVPRAVQTMRQLLRRLVTGLPSVGGDELLARIDQATASVSPIELQLRVESGMRHALMFTVDEDGPQPGETDQQRADREERNALLGEKDDQGARRNGLADLIVQDALSRRLHRPDGYLAQLVRSYFEETSQRDTSEGFSEEALPLNEAGVRRALGGAGSPLLETWESIRYDPKPALDLLNRALTLALPHALGLSSQHGETLSQLFEESRAELKKQGKELVLLFEDLVQFGLVDGELYDQFTIQPGASLAPLRVVFAITDGRFAVIPQTVLTRLSHRYEIDVSALPDKKAFLARYLNLARTGRPGTIAAREAQGQKSNWMTNHCSVAEHGQPCRFREECHRDFGFVEVPELGDVGIYPYTDAALGRALRKQAEASPRKLMDLCITQTLVEAETHVEAGTYPHAGIDQVFDVSLRGSSRQELVGNAQGEGADQLFRAKVVWGDEDSLPLTVIEAFSLAAEPKPRDISDDQATEATDRKEEKQNPPGHPDPLTHLWNWQAGSDLPDREVDVIRSTLYDLLAARLDLDQDLVHIHTGVGQAKLTEVLTRLSFVVPDHGRVPSARAARFDLSRSAEDVRLVAAARWFRDHGHFDPAAADVLWQFPRGYQPAELAIELESRLTLWADAVREKFEERVGARALAVGALGVRAVALMASGVSPDRLTTATDVLSAEPPRGAPPHAWARAGRQAVSLLSGARAREYVDGFASVRQSERGDVQMIDSAGLDPLVQQFVRAPWESLMRVSSEFVERDPDLALDAKSFAEALSAEAQAFLGELDDAVRRWHHFSEGFPASRIGEVALDTGRMAINDGLFDSPHGWATFEDAAVKLRSSVTEGLPEWDASGHLDTVGAALEAQSWARNFLELASALDEVTASMSATRAKCDRVGGAVGDVKRLKSSITESIAKVRDVLSSFKQGVKS